MSTKKVLSRIQNKHDTAANWALATHFVPLPGEIIIYDRDENYSYPRIKIGDGVRCPEELPFANLPMDNSNQGIYQLYSNMVQSLEDDVTDANYPSADAVKAYVASNTMRAYSTSITLGNWESAGISSVNGSRYDVAVDGVTATNIVQVSPAPESYELWSEYSIRCTSQSDDGTLRFECPGFGPTESITVNILIFDTFEYSDNKEY